MGLEVFCTPDSQQPVKSPHACARFCWPDTDPAPRSIRQCSLLTCAPSVQPLRAGPKKIWSEGLKIPALLSQGSGQQCGRHLETNLKLSGSDRTAHGAAEKAHNLRPRLLVSWKRHCCCLLFQLFIPLYSHGIISYQGVCSLGRFSVSNPACAPAGAPKHAPFPHVFLSCAQLHRTFVFRPWWPLKSCRIHVVLFTVS